MTTRKFTAFKAAFGSLLITVLTLGVATVPQGVSAATVVDDNTIRVESGDTLSEIARDFLGDASRYPEIAEMNGIEDPNRIYVGQEFDLPEGANMDQPSTGSTSGGSTSGSTSGSTGSSSSDDQNLTDLFILQELFNQKGDTAGTGERDFFDLILLDQLSGKQGDGILGEDSNLTDLFILNEMFNQDGGSAFGGDGERSIFDLILLEKLSGEDNSSILGKDSNLTDLFILQELFNKNNKNTEQQPSNGTGKAQ